MQSLESDPADAAAVVKSKKVDVAAEEDVDIGEDIPMGNFPPVVIEKDVDIEESNSSGSSSSSSDSSSSSGTKLPKPKPLFMSCLFQCSFGVLNVCLIFCCRFRFGKFLRQRFGCR